MHQHDLHQHDLLQQDLLQQNMHQQDLLPQDLQSDGHVQMSPKVLVADDDLCVLRAVSERLNQMGFAVETATSGLQALVKASENRPDLLVIDVHMPEVDGLSVLSMLVDNARKSREVIVMTGRPGQEIAELSHWFGAPCIRKDAGFWGELEKRISALYPERAREVRQACDPEPAAPIKSRPSVLLIDDDVNVRRFYFRKLGHLGADLLYAADGTRGFWMARHQEPTVIVADYAMPHGDAQYLLTRLRSVPETAAIPVVVQSGRHLGYAIKQELQSEINGQPGAARVLQKSADVSELYEVLRRLCGFASDLDGAPLYH